MGVYSYKALAADGKIRKGVLDGESERHVRTQLRSRQLKPIEVKPGEARSSLNTSLTGSSLFSGHKRIKIAELALFSRQLATLLQSGIPLEEALSAVAKQSKSVQVKTLIIQVRSQVMAGHSLASSLSEYPQEFSEMFRAMVRAGESAGQLGLVLEHLADYIESRHYTQQKLKMAMAYPIVLMGVALTVIALLLVFVIPELVNLFAHSDAELPAITRWLVSGSNMMITYWWLLLLLLILLLGLVGKLSQLPGWRLQYHRLLLRLPVVRGLVIALDTARYAATLSMLVTSGVPLVDGLRIATAVMNNQVLKSACSHIPRNVQEGGSLASAMEECRIFPPVMLQMIASGENSGSLENMLTRSAITQERELEMTLATLLGIMEPLLIVIMATVVGAIVMAVLLPVMQMNTLVA